MPGIEEEMDADGLHWVLGSVVSQRKPASPQRPAAASMPGFQLAEQPLLRRALGRLENASRLL
jgi:hypothetical protein